jgi:hypothetical protein
VAFYEDDEEEGKEGQPQTLGAPSSVISGAESQSPQAPAPAQAAAHAPKPEPFFGISQYINANRPQSEKLADRVAGQVNQKAGAVDEALNSASNSFNQAASSQEIKPDEDLFSQVRSSAEQVASDPNKVNQFNSFKNAQYTGPKSLEDLDSGSAWSGIQSALAKAKQAKDSTATEQGRMGLVKELAAGKNPSQGALTFDNLLLQSNPQAISKLQAAGSGLKDADERLKAANLTAQTKAKSIEDQDALVRSSAQNAITSGWDDLKNSLTQRELEKDNEQKANVESLRDAIKTGNLSPEQLGVLGLDPNLRTYGQDLSRYINYKDDADIYSGATDSDVARQNALLSLAGDIDLGGPILSSAKAIGQTGKGFTLDPAGIKSAQVSGSLPYIQAMNERGGANQLGVKTLDGRLWPDKQSLASVIKVYEDMSKGELVRSDAESKQAAKYLKDVLYPMRDKIQKQYGYNDTLTKRGG